MQCKWCKFWERDQFGRPTGGPHTDGTVSACRRHAPQAPAGITERQQGYGTSASRVFPMTGEGDWCGDFVAYSEPEAVPPSLV